MEGFDDAGVINRARFPWEEDPFHPVREELTTPDGRWTFGLEDWGGSRHTNAWVAQDFRFRWSLRECANRNARQVSRLLGMASPLYERLLRLTVFCPNCGGGGGRHTARRWSSVADAYPSLLALELRTGEWVAAVRDGRHVDAPMAPKDVWWASSIPSGAALTQSPLRFLALTDPAAGVNSRLRELAGIHSLADADRDSILRLLQRLRDDFARAALEPDPGSSSGARRAFVGLHRQAYERLSDLSAPEGDEDDGRGCARRPLRRRGRSGVSPAGRGLPRRWRVRVLPPLLQRTHPVRGACKGEGFRRRASWDTALRGRAQASRIRPAAGRHGRSDGRCLPTAYRSSWRSSSTTSSRGRRSTRRGQTSRRVRGG